MARQKRVEFVMLTLSYIPELHPEFPCITLKRKKRSPQNLMSYVQQWFDRNMTKEKSRIPANLKVRFSELSILTSNKDLFTIYGYRFDSVFLLLGEDTKYWLYHHDSSMRRRMEGSSPLSDNFCTCCLPNQYIKIMQSVKEGIMRTCDLK